jgi:hypothetical protein
LINHIFALGVLIISVSFSYFIYLKSGQNTESVYWAIYAFGAFFLPGIFTVYPGFSKKKNSRGFEVKIPRDKNLSRFQAASILCWIVGLGLLIVYVTQF